MLWGNSETRWGLISQLFHWGMAIGIVGTALGGMYMTSLPASPDKFWLYMMHKSFGLILLGWVALRIGWRFLNPTPKLPADTPPLQQKIALGTHIALYGLMIGIPLSGFVMHSASSIPFRLFGIWTVPKLFAEPSMEILTLAKNAHQTMFMALGILVLLHIAAALKHHFINRDDILKRMLPFARTLGAVLLVTWAGAGQAADWNVLENSRLGFTGTQSGTPFNGRFEQFDAVIHFDEQQLSDSRFEVTIDTTSVNTNSAERDEILSTSDWFHFRQFTDATFKTKSFTQNGDRYEALGDLTIRGITREVVLSFTWTAHGEEAKLQGEALLDRRDFEVGIGEWASDSMVGYDVKVTVELALRRP